MKKRKRKRFPLEIYLEEFEAEYFSLEIGHQI